MHALVLNFCPEQTAHHFHSPFTGWNRTTLYFSRVGRCNSIMCFKGSRAGIFVNSSPNEHHTHVHRPHLLLAYGRSLRFHPVIAPSQSQGILVDKRSSRSEWIVVWSPATKIALCSHHWFRCWNSNTDMWPWPKTDFWDVSCFHGCEPCPEWPCLENQERNTIQGGKQRIRHSAETSTAGKQSPCWKTRACVARLTSRHMGWRV